MNNATPTLSYRRAAHQVIFFGSILTIMFGFFVIVVTILLKTEGQFSLAEKWVFLSGCSMVTAFLFTAGIALALRAEGNQD